MKHTNDHYVYVYCDPRKNGFFRYEGLDFVFNQEPFYVGCGRGYRWRRHLTQYEMDWNYNTIKNGKIKKILSENIDLSKFVVFYKTNITREDALKLEADIICKIKRIPHGPLSNMTDGGEKHVAGLSSQNKGKTYEEIYGFEKAQEMKQKRREALLGNTLGSRKKGKKMSEAQKIKLSNLKSKKVKQMDSDFNVIKIWDSSKKAADYLGIYVGSIHNVLGSSTKSRSSGGYYWEYIDRDNPKYKALKPCRSS